MADIPTTAWSETSPAGSDNIALGDNRIRELKTQIREVIDVDHDFPSSGQAADVGQHKQVTLQEAADIGTGAEGVPILGAQTINGKAELVFTDEDDNDIQITDNGKIRQQSVDNLPNDTTLKAKDAAGTGTVDLIKANASDQPEIPDAVSLVGGAILTEATSPTTAANQGAVYTKNDGTQTELYFREESDGDEVQITDGGSLKGVLENVISSIEDYGTSTSSGSAKTQNNIHIAYGRTSVSGSGSQAITNLNFNSQTSYTVVACFGSAQSATESVEVVQNSGSQFTLYNRDNLAQTINWIAIGI